MPSGKPDGTENGRSQQTPPALKMRPGSRNACWPCVVARACCVLKPQTRFVSTFCHRSMSGVARARLGEERKNWRKDHPFGFVAKPCQMADGSVDIMRWSCTIPGKKGTLWENGNYPVALRFSENYPTLPPDCAFPQGFFHPNGR
jgi:Ubiquitin-conjugating enzyme